MKRTKRISTGVATLATAGVVFLAGPVLAGTKTDVGKIQGNDKSKVIARVTTKHGKPKKLVKLKLKNIDLECVGGATQQRSATLRGIKVNKRHGKYKFSKSSTDRDRFTTVAKGNVKKHGKKVVGKVTMSAENPFICRPGGGKFQASR